MLEFAKQKAPNPPNSGNQALASACFRTLRWTVAIAASILHRMPDELLRSCVFADSPAVSFSLLVELCT